MNHTYYMSRCIALAQKGLGDVSPNPMVGSVIVKDGEIIGEGYHQKLGGPHAEVNAIASVVNEADLKESTIYVNLEPCSHHGKTPPCASLILEKGIPRVVMAMLDPNPKVAGRGARMLREAEVEVIKGVLEEESRFLNRRFLTFHEKKRPYIILKWAESNDGFMDRDRSQDGQTGPHWISHPETKKVVHRWRAEEDAILVGAETVRNDNPSLTVREVKGKNPIRIIINPSNDLPATAQIFNDGVKTIVFGGTENKQSGAVQWIPFDANSNLADMLSTLHELEIGSIFVEGGRKTLQSFIDQNIWDEARIIRGTSELKQGLQAPSINRKQAKISVLGVDTLYTLYNT